MSDMLGNRRFIASLDSVSTFSNFDFLYLDLRSRMNWGVRLFDDRTYFVSVNRQQAQLERERRLYRQTGIIGLLSYPFDRYHRLDFGGGYMSRDIDYPRVVLDGDGNPQRVFLPRQDNFPMLSSTFTGDSAVFRSFGPISGRRYEVTGSYAYSTNGGGSLSEDVVLDFRQYLQVTSRSLLAARVFAGYSGGSAPNFYYFGGLNTLRGYDFRTFVGDRAFFGNFEYRFPLVDVIATPLFALSQIRGSLFFDIGGAYFKGDPFTFSSGQRLEDARAAVGYGVSMNVFGLELHWDFARRTDLKTFDDRSRTTYWI
jgi:outer membrane protein assembly factor BamA